MTGKKSQKGCSFSTKFILQMHIIALAYLWCCGVAKTNGNHTGILLYLFHLIKPQKLASVSLHFKAAVLKQQISKFKISKYHKVLSIEDSFYIYDRPLTELNVIAASEQICGKNFDICFHVMRYVDLQCPLHCITKWLNIRSQKQRRTIAHD